MKAIGRILGRLVAVGLSYVVACIAAGLTVAGSYVARAFLEGGIAIPHERLVAETLYVSGLVAVFVAVYAFAPAVVAIVVAEVFAIRRAIYYAICGGLAGASGYAAFSGYPGPDAGRPGLDNGLVMFIGAGLVAGLVYWSLGGRSAGVLERPAA